jgi:hypothetical protein
VSDSQDLIDSCEGDIFSHSLDIVEIVDRSLRIVAWVGPMVCRVDGHC